MFPAIGRADQMTDTRQDISIIPSRAVRDPSLSKVDLMVLASIGMYSNRAGVAWPGLHTLAEASGLHRNTIANATVRLVRAGYLRRLKGRSDLQEKGRFGMSNRWQLLY